VSDKVVSFPGAEPLPENLIQVADSKPHNYCQHGTITLDPHKRLVECSVCGAVLDPFDFLEQQARLLQRAWQHHGMAQAKVTELNTSIGNLQTELKRLKGQVARARDKVPAIDVRGKDKL
jgi:uncharacterized small protein (DUF1192 family)